MTVCTHPRRRRRWSPAQEYDVEVVLDACAYRLDPGQTLRLSVAGADWPNTIAPPAPVTLTVHGGSLELPSGRAPRSSHRRSHRARTTSSEEPGDISWTVTRDVLRDTTTCAVRHGAEYDVPHDGRASEQYAGAVVVDRRTFAQHASADCTYRLTWPGIDVSVSSTMRVDVTADGLRRGHRPRRLRRRGPDLAPHLERAHPPLVLGGRSVRWLSRGPARAPVLETTRSSGFETLALTAVAPQPPKIVSGSVLPRSRGRSRGAGSRRCPRRSCRSWRRGPSARPGTRGCSRCRRGSGSPSR